MNSLVTYTVSLIKECILLLKSSKELTLIDRSGNLLKCEQSCYQASILTEIHETPCFTYGLLVSLGRSPCDSLFLKYDKSSVNVADFFESALVCNEWSHLLLAVRKYSCCFWIQHGRSHLGLRATLEVFSCDWSKYRN